ncbi:MAG: hypothetical protein WDM87_17035 [Terracidiphilus sp.]
MNGDLGLVPRTGFQEINTPKLDWQVSDKEHVSVLFHRLRWDAPGDVQTSSTNDYARDTWGNDFVKLDYGVAKLTSLITSSMSNELLYQYSRELLDETQQPLTSYTKNYLEGNGITANKSIPEIAMDTSEGMNLGSPYYSYRLANPAEINGRLAISSTGARANTASNSASTNCTIMTSTILMAVTATAITSIVTLAITSTTS